MMKFFSAILCSGLLFCWVRADFIQKAGGQQFRWGEDGTLQEYRVGGKPKSVGNARLFAALDAETGKRADFTGKFTAEADGTVRYRGSAPDLALELDVLFRPDATGFLRAQATLINRSGQKERAIELCVSLPLAAGSWNFNALEGADSDSGAVKTTPGHVYEELREIANPRFTMSLSRLPFGAVDDGEAGVMLAHPLRQPRFARYGFSVDDAGCGTLTMKTPLGISADTAKFPNRATVDFLIGSFRADRHLRGALARYHEHEPQLFRSHIGYPGAWALWIPDFSMAAARECGMGFNQREWDEDFARDPAEAVRILDTTRQYGIKSLLYSEPWSITLPFPRNWHKVHQDLSVRQFEDQVPVKLGAVKEYVETLRGDPAPTERFAGELTNDELYRILQNSAIEINDNGDWRLNCYWAGQFHWGRKFKGQDSGAVIVNPDPEIQKPNRDTITYEKARYGYAWKQLAKHGRKADGFYIDSEGFAMGWSECNLRRDHWKVADLPLTYATFPEDGKLRVFQHMILACNDFLEDMRRRADALDYCIATNTWTHFVNFLTPYGDMIGAGEFFNKDWIAPLADFREFRYSAGRKLVTTMDYVLNYEGGVPVTAEGVATYLEPRLNTYLQYGIFAGTANSWNQPEKVALLIPAMKRYAQWTLMLNEAGWEEIPNVVLSGGAAGKVLVERWGNRPGKGLYYTLCNRPPHNGNVTLAELAAWPAQRVTLQWNPGDFGVTELTEVTELISGRKLPVAQRDGKLVCDVEIPGGRTLLLQVK